MDVHLKKGDTLELGDLKQVKKPILFNQSLDSNYSIIRINKGLQSKWFNNVTWSQFTF